MDELMGTIVGLIAGPFAAAIGGTAVAVVGGLTAEKIDAGYPG